MPAPISKHGTLMEDDLVDAREIDLDQVLQHALTASTSHLFGKVGAPPPDSAVVMDKRFTKVWGVEGEKDTPYVGLSKSNSAAKGKFELANLPQGQYKLVLKVLRPESSLFDIIPVGTVIGNISALGATSPERKEQVLARGMPTEYVLCQVQASSTETTGETEMIVHASDELDQAHSEMVRTFTVGKGKTGKVNLVCTSFSLVKRMRLSAELFRCDLPSKQNMAKQAKYMLNQAMKRAPPPPPSVGARPRRHSRKKRSVELDASCDIPSILDKFYTRYCPEKVLEVPQIMSFFYSRDGHLGVLFATLEDKYRVKFSPNGKWTELAA